MKTDDTTAAPGVIEPGHVYRLDEFARRAGLGRHALRTARRAGLRVIYTAGRGYVRGEDWAAYIASKIATPA